jgi:spore coat protein B
MIRQQKDSQSVESNAYLKSLVGKRVKVYRGGPESCEGRLLDVQSDYVALMPEQSNDNKQNNNANNNNNAKKDNAIIYYNLRHVQSVSENLKANSVESNLKHVQNIVQSISENIYSNLRHVQSISENLIANLKHVQSIDKNSTANSVESNLKLAQNVSENSKANSIEWSIDFDNHPELVSANNFTELLKNLTGSMVKVNQGGPESKKGILLVVAGDYIGLLTEDDGIVFYNTTHIKSISVQNRSQNIDQNIDQSTPLSNSPIHYDNYFDDIHAQNFLELFDYFAYKWVSINRGGPEAAEGILVQEEGEHYTLVNNDEVIRIYPYHIKSISIGTKGFLKQQQQQQNQQQQNNETTENENNKDWVMTNKIEDNKTSDREQRTKVVEVERTSDKNDRTNRRSSPQEKIVKETIVVEDNGTSDREQHTSQKSSSQETVILEDNRTSNRDHHTSQRSSPQEKIVKETIVKTIDYIWDPKR